MDKASEVEILNISKTSKLGTLNWTVGHSVTSLHKDVRW